MATSQTTRVTGEEPIRKTELTAGCLEDSLAVLSIKVNLHSLIQQILVYTGELRAQVSHHVIRNKTKHQSGALSLVEILCSDYRRLYGIRELE